MKRIVLSIIESSRETVDAWNKYGKNSSARNRSQVLKSLERLEQAVNRLDRIKDA
jgi:hypothetical protein